MSVKKHTAFNLIGAVIPMAVSVVTVPPFLHIIGPERFGVLSLFWLLLGYFGLFDLGLGRALSQRLAELHQSDPAERSEVFWAAIGVSTLIGLGTMLLLMLVSGLLLGLVKVGSLELSVEIRDAIPLFAATLPVALLNGVLSGALTGRERFGVANLVDGIANVLAVLVPLATAWYIGPRLFDLLGGVLIVRASALTALAIATRSAVPARRPTRPRGDTLRPLMSYGGWVTVESIVGSAIHLWDRFAIGATLGAVAVTTYVIPANVILRLLVIPAAFTRALFPRLVRESHDDAGRLMADSARALTLLLTPATIGLCALAGPLLTLWLGRAMASKSLPIAAIILPGVFANSIALVFFNYLQARKRVASIAKLHLAELLPYAGLLYLLMSRFGIEGAALAWAIRASLDAALLAWLAQAPWRQLTGVVGQFAITFGAAVVTINLPSDRLTFWGLQALLLAIGCLWSWLDAPWGVRQSVLQYLRPAQWLRP